jgi:hypothetical protein
VKLTRSAVVVVAMAAAVLTPTAAQAQAVTTPDAAGDMVLLTLPGGSTAPAPDRAEGDIISSRVQHKAKALVMTMQYRELTAGQTALHWYGIRTGAMKRFALLQADAAHPSGRVRLFKPNGKVVRCHVGHAIDYTANTATVRVPSSCLGKPRRVKVAMQVGMAISSTQIYVDDAHNTGGWIPSYGGWVRR